VTQNAKDALKLRELVTCGREKLRKNLAIPSPLMVPRCCERDTCAICTRSGAISYLLKCGKLWPARLLPRSPGVHGGRLVSATKSGFYPYRPRPYWRFELPLLTVSLIKFLTEHKPGVN
jgi:hypothetical protein